MLSSVPTTALEAVPQLAELYLSGNPLKILRDDAFSHFTNLATLEISSSRLRIIEGRAFSGLASLRTLKIADNSLAVVPTPAMRPLANLEVLDVGRNAFKTIPPAAFSIFRKLKKFDLSGCGHLRVIEAGAFSGCVDLEHITVSLNRRLDRIQPGAFDAMPKIRSADFADNGLPFLPENLVPWRQLRRLDLSGNPWSCADCDLVLFISSAFQSNSNISARNGGKCASPDEFAHMPLTQYLAESRLKCAAAVQHPPQQQHPNEVFLPVEEGESSQRRRHEEMVRQSNSLAVIVSVCVVVLVLVVAALLFVFVRFRTRVEKWLKDVRWRHQSGMHAGYKAGTLASSSAGGREDVYQPPGSEYHDPRYGHHAVPPPLGPPPPVPSSPAVSGAHVAYDDEHYYYVATMNNRLAATGKHIPVTEL